MRESRVQIENSGYKATFRAVEMEIPAKKWAPTTRLLIITYVVGLVFCSVSLVLAMNQLSGYYVNGLICVITIIAVLLSPLRMIGLQGWWGKAYAMVVFAASVAIVGALFPGAVFLSRHRLIPLRLLGVILIVALLLMTFWWFEAML